MAAHLPADETAWVELSAPELLARGFRDYERYRVTIASADGTPVTQQRDLIRGGRVAAVLPIDLVRDEIVLIRQFRLAAHLAGGRGNLVEIVAGRIEPGERPEETALRECREEIGLAPIRLVALFSYLTTPGLTDEEISVFLASVDAAHLPQHTATGDEHVTVLRTPIGAALEALARGRLRNGPLLVALQWLALNRARLPDLLGSA
ncbi:MAG: NUDIX domain-containing protein [Pseudolabrys sp.]|nr:NUDIX domain-containing protein [Pseudolabrys sp.]